MDNSHALAAGTITTGEITALKHKFRNDAVESGALVVEGLSELSLALLARAQAPEVLGSAGRDVVEQLKRHATSGLAACKTQ